MNDNSFDIWQYAIDNGVDQYELMGALATGLTLALIPPLAYLVVKLAQCGTRK